MIIRQVTQDRVDRAQPLEQVEDQADHAAHLLVGIEHHLTGGAAHEPDRQRHRQLASPGLADPPGPHPLLDQVQFTFADRALKPQQHPVIVLGRVVNPVHVAQQRTGKRAQLKKLVPLTPRPGQPGHLDAEHDAHVIESDLGDKALEPGPGICARGGMPQILVDHQDPRRRPAQRDRALCQPVLQPRGLLMVNDLGRSGLTDVHGRQPITMPGLNLALRPLPRQPHRHTHRTHPRPGRSLPPSGPSARPADPAGTRPPPGSPPGTPPTTARSPVHPGSGEHASVCGHCAPPSPAPAPASRSRRTTATAASRPSIPTTGTFPLATPSMYAFRLAP